MMFTQAPKFWAMLTMSLETSSDKKKKECDKLDLIEQKLGPEKLIQMMECEGDFAMAFKHAKAFCRVGARSVGTTAIPIADEGHTCNMHMCNIAKAQASLFIYKYIV